MKLSTKGRYAVMAMADLAQHDEGGPVALADIAERQNISVSYLEQLFSKLRKFGIVESIRGPGGGYMMSNSSCETRISDIVIAVDERIMQTRCTPGESIGCSGTTGRCLTHDLWEELGNQIHMFLNSVSLEDVVTRRVVGMSAILHDGSEERCAR